jgi:hypothetical protein
MLPDPKTTSAAVYVYTGVLDMRVGFDRLAARIQEEYNCILILDESYYPHGTFAFRALERINLVDPLDASSPRR